MWQILGIWFDWEGNECEEVRASFDSKEMAEEYEKASRLKKPGDWGPYKQKSLLRGLHRCEIIWLRLPKPPPHNPSPPF